MSLDIDDIARLFAERGGNAYSGEAVSQTEHALQAAWLAEQDGAGDALVTAALLHDLGHLIAACTPGGSPSLHGVDDLHQYAALPFLRGLFGPEVLEPIRLHVDAKRFLCATRLGYCDTLSPDSVRSLALQGGAFDADEAATFIATPWADDAVRLRLWDDEAKCRGRATPTLESGLARAARIALR